MVDSTYGSKLAIFELTEFNDRAEMDELEKSIAQLVRTELIEYFLEVLLATVGQSTEDMALLPILMSLGNLLLFLIKFYCASCLIL